MSKRKMVALAALAAALLAGCYFGAVLHLTTNVQIDLSTPYRGVVAVSRNHQWVFRGLQTAVRSIGLVSAVGRGRNARRAASTR
jgi:hypothetical protein